MNKTVRRLVFLAAAFVAALQSCPVAQAQQTGTISDNDMKVVDFVDLEYPQLARQTRIQGVVVVWARLDEKGTVLEATALSGAEVLIPASLENVRKWRFQPNAKKAVVIVYNFRVTDAEAKSGCSHFSLEPPNFANITACANKIQ
jgi:TonB family protein